MTAVETRDLTKTFGQKTAVNGLNLGIGEGEFYALLGVNGAGKTTSIRMLTGLTSPTSGEARILGRDCVKERKAVRELIGISPQETAAAENLTVEENLDFMADVWSLGGDRRKAVLEGLRESFSLDGVWRSRVKTLSGGWKRRLSVAMALTGEPKVLFLDEPTLGMDVLARRELWRALESLRGRMTVVMTTHYMEEAEALADRIGVMTAGRLTAEGTLPELERLTGQSGLENVFIALAENAGAPGVGEEKRMGGGSHA